MQWQLQNNILFIYLYDAKNIIYLVTVLQAVSVCIMYFLDNEEIYIPTKVTANTNLWNKLW